MYGFVQFKQARSREAIKQVTAAVATVSGNKTFDIHARQMLLDNSLRGGTPMILGEVDDVAKLKTFDEDPRLKVYHVFSRFDGDLERDYNDFEVDPLFYSQVSLGQAAHSGSFFTKYQHVVKPGIREIPRSDSESKE